MGFLLILHLRTTKFAFPCFPTLDPFSEPFSKLLMKHKLRQTTSLDLLSCEVTTQLLQRGPYCTTID